jgi:hypothetical protein
VWPLGWLQRCTVSSRVLLTLKLMLTPMPTSVPVLVLVLVLVPVLMPVPVPVFRACMPSSPVTKDITTMTTRHHTCRVHLGE